MDSRTHCSQPFAGDEMSRPASSAPAKPTIGERGFHFCHWGITPLLEVRADAPSEDVREQAYMLMTTIGEVLATRIGEGAISSADDAILDTGTAYILRFAADAAAAMVGSLEVKA